MNQAFICDAVRTPFGRFGGTLATLRADDLAALPLKALLARNPGLDPSRIDDVIFGCANQAGEDNRNVAHMATLLAGYPQSVSGTTINRLCGSGLDAIGFAARAIKAGDEEIAMNPRSASVRLRAVELTRPIPERWRKRFDQGNDYASMKRQGRRG